MGLEQPICSLLTNILQTLWLRNGSITTGDRSLKDIDLKWWRSQIGLVQQEPFLFNDSIYRNVEHGLVGTQWENAPLETKKDLVKQACAEAFADEFIDRLPEVSRYTSTVVSAMPSEPERKMFDADLFHRGTQPSSANPASNSAEGNANDWP